MKNCLEQSTKEGVLFLSSRGGYYDLPNDSFNNFPYYFVDNKSSVIEKSHLEIELEKYMNDQMLFCTRHFDSFKGVVDIKEKGSIKTSITLNDDSIQADLTFPLDITDNNKLNSISSFQYNYETKLGEIIGAIDALMKDREKNPSATCISCIADVSDNKNLDFELWDLSENATLYSVRDRNNNLTVKFLVPIYYAEVE